MVTEIELKLLVAAEHLTRLRRHPLLRAGGGGKARSRKFIAEYYDTAEFDLRRAGVALRLRREGRRILQTVKREGRVEGGLHQRPEWETEARDGQLNFAALAETGWCKHFGDPGLRDRLKPIFTTEFRRTIRMIEPSPGCAIEFCLDQGEIRAQGKTQPILEVELELRSGAPSALYDLALALDQTIPLKIERRSKAERGYLLLAQLAPAPVKAARIKLSGEISVTAAFKQIAFNCIAHLEKNEAGTLAQADPEYLHQMRVAVRRLRSAFSMFRAAFPGAELREYIAEAQWLGQMLGPARDWDVFDIETLPGIAAQFPAHAGIARIAEQSARARAGANKVAIEAIAARRYQQFLLRLSAWLTASLISPHLSAASNDGGSPITGAAAVEPPAAEPLASQPAVAEPAAVEPAAATVECVLPTSLPEYASRILNKRHKQVKKRGRKLAALTAAERHQLRIAVKKLRYAGEFFSSLYAKSAVRKFTAELTGLQEVLGALNDATITRTLLLRLSASDAAEQEAVGIVAGFNVAQTHEKLAALGQRWRVFRRAKTFWS